MLQAGPDACAGAANKEHQNLPTYGELRRAAIADASPMTTTARFVLLTRDVLDSVAATHQEWKKLERTTGAAVKEQFLKRLAARSRGAERSTCCAMDQDSVASSNSRTFRPASGL